MALERNLWEKAVDFHGHVCMGLARGCRVAQAAMQVFKERDIDEELVAIVENDSCSIDAIQVLIGCTLGKGNLIYRDYGKSVYTFIRRRDKKAIRVTLQDYPEESSAELKNLREKVFSGKASTEEKELLKTKNEEQIAYYLSRPLKEVCIVQEIATEIPGKARIFPSVTCSSCGEKVMEPRARLKNGKIVCIPCSEDYTRGW
ncbi:MAG: formylmethanofuran dehydrogenase [Firmicutes bacterium]|nr:formylmethanofuran dehydrogenase [Bacillota bacterium]